MRINTGQGYISGLILLTIWSISAITSLPGLAISPVLGEIKALYPKDSQLQIELLTSLPSLLIIPFILLSGKLAQHVNKVALLSIGLLIYLSSAIGYMLAQNLEQLVWMGALLGIGAGIVTPLSTSFIFHIFTQRFRVSQMGYSSAISNGALVLATYLSGVLANIHWKLTFLVYLAPALTLMLLAICQRNRGLSDALSFEVRSKKVDTIILLNQEPQTHKLIPLIFFYFTITYTSLTFVYNLPFLLEDQGHSSNYTGLLLSLFFICIMIPGFYLHSILKKMKQLVNIVCCFALSLGLLLPIATSQQEVIILACILAGMSYGVMQPLVYEKTADISSPAHATLMLGIIMATNFLAILLYPIIMKGLSLILHLNQSTDAFLVNGVLCLLFSIMSCFFSSSFTISINRKYYEPHPNES